MLAGKIQVEQRNGYLLDVVHLTGGLIGDLLITEANKAKATATSGIAVFDDNLGDLCQDSDSSQTRSVITASSTCPNSSNLVRRALSSVCHARPLRWVSAHSRPPDAGWTYPMKSLDIFKDG